VIELGLEIAVVVLAGIFAVGLLPWRDDQLADVVDSLRWACNRARAVVRVITSSQVVGWR